MIDNEIIQKILKENKLKPQYNYEYNKAMAEKDLVIFWKDYYSTPALWQDKKKVFLKILLNDQKIDDFTGQISFFDFVSRQPLQKVFFPKILSYSKSPYPYIIIEYINGEALGYLDAIKEKFFRPNLVNAVFSGVMELQQVIPDYTKYNQPWKKVKDFSWFIAFIQDLKKRQEQLTKRNINSVIKQNDLNEAESIVSTLSKKLTIKLVPLYGDINPGNIIVGENEDKICLIDQAPFFIGNHLADITEFGSYCLLNSFPWNNFLNFLPELDRKEKLIKLMNLAVFMIDRAIKNYELTAVFGREELHNKNAMLAKSIFTSTVNELKKLL